MGAETFGSADACDYDIVIQHDLKETLGKNLKIELLKDSDTLFNLIIWNESTTEKRLMIDVKAEREAYNDGIINDILWIRTQHRVDAMTKDDFLPEFITAIEMNQLHYHVE